MCGVCLYFVPFFPLLHCLAYLARPSMLYCCCCCCHCCYPQELKQEIKHTLQNKLHRNAGPEDLVAAEAMLQRILGEQNMDAMYELAATCMS